MLPCPRSSQPPGDSPTRSQPAKMPAIPQTSQRCFAHQSASSSQPNTSSSGSAYPTSMWATSVAAISLPDAIQRRHWQWAYGQDRRDPPVNRILNNPYSQRHHITTLPFLSPTCRCTSSPRLPHLVSNLKLLENKYIIKLSKCQPPHLILKWWGSRPLTGSISSSLISILLFR